MARALRIQFPGAVYHVTARGDRQEAIFVDDEDRRCLLELVAQAMDRFDAAVIAYCLMGNHYHFVIHTRQANLSRLMRHLNAGYSQAFNRRHEIVGHLFQDRFKAIVVDKDSYLLELCRYVELNPVRARMVESAGDWQWSSYRAHVGIAMSPAWLDVDLMHGQLLGHDVRDKRDRRRGQSQYAALVAAGRGVKLWDGALRQQIYLGNQNFIEAIQLRAPPIRLVDEEILQPHRSKPKTLAQWLTICSTHEEALRLAHLQSGLSMSAIATELNRSVSWVSRLIARAEARLAQSGGEVEAKGKT
jgi:REP element-mobilizing transposase RayT